MKSSEPYRGHFGVTRPLFTVLLFSSAYKYVVLFGELKTLVCGLRMDANTQKSSRCQYKPYQALSKDWCPSLAPALAKSLRNAESCSMSRLALVPGSHRQQFQGASFKSTGCSLNPNSNLKSNPNTHN